MPQHMDELPRTGRHGTNTSSLQVAATSFVFQPPPACFLQLVQDASRAVKPAITGDAATRQLLPRREPEQGESIKPRKEKEGPAATPFTRPAVPPPTSATAPTSVRSAGEGAAVEDSTKSVAQGTTHSSSVYTVKPSQAHTAAANAGRPSTPVSNTTQPQRMTGAELLLKAIDHVARLDAAAVTKSHATPACTPPASPLQWHKTMDMSTSDEERCNDIMALWEQTTGTTPQRANALDNMIKGRHGTNAIIEDQDDVLCTNLMDAWDATTGTTSERQQQMAAALSRPAPVTACEHA